MLLAPNKGLIDSQFGLLMTFLTRGFHCLKHNYLIYEAYIIWLDCSSVSCKKQSLAKNSSRPDSDMAADNKSSIERLQSV